MAFLRTVYLTPESKRNFANALWQLLPPFPEEPMIFNAELPVSECVSEQTHTLHLAALAFDVNSVIEDPSTERCLKLADEILTDGFLSEAEPLQVNCPLNHGLGWEDFIPPWGASTAEGKPTLRPFSVWHHKSALRASTAMVICHLFAEAADDTNVAGIGVVGGWVGDV